MDVRLILKKEEDTGTLPEYKIRVGLGTQEAFLMTTNREVNSETCYSLLGESYNE